MTGFMVKLKAATAIDRYFDVNRVPVETRFIYNLGVEIKAGAENRQQIDVFSR